MVAIPLNKHITYQAQYRRCGKKCPTCAQGRRHGPYLYAYWREGKRMRSKSTGVLKIETVQAYFRQVYRVREELLQAHWEDLKRRVLQQDIADHLLRQEQLRLLVLECKEHVSQRRKRKKLAVVEREKEDAHWRQDAIAG